MPEFLFYPETHTYTLDGKEIPSVTQLVEIYSTAKIEEDSDLELTFESAAERGTLLHGYLEHRLTGGEIEDYEIPGAYSGYVEAINLFLAEHELEPMLIETPMYSTSMRNVLNEIMPFAGKPDYVGWFDGDLSVADWKFVSQIQKTKVGAQLCGYNELCEDNGIYPEKLYCVQFLPNGEYRLYPVERFRDTFGLCLIVHQEKNMKHPRGGITA